MTFEDGYTGDGFTHQADEDYAEQEACVHAAEDGWYERRGELCEGQVFECFDGSRVKLDRTVPGDGTKWYVATWYGRSWSYEDATIEPGDLKTLVEVAA